MNGDVNLHTIQMQDYVQRWQSGDTKAAEDLYRAIADRMEHLARCMLRRYPNVRIWVETVDVLQGSVWRLLVTLRNLQPPSMRDFFNLAAAHVRRELLDLARRFAGKIPPGSGENLDDSRFHPPLGESSDELELWSRFHEAVENLPVEEREVFSLAFYNGWSQKEVAEMLGISERTVRRRWAAACVVLARLVGGRIPSLD